jgi:predicted dehydrogenase
MNSIKGTSLPVESPSAGNRPRVALVGLSGYGAVHLAELLHLRDTGRIDLTACVAIDAQAHPEIVRSLAANGCDLHGDYHAMIRAHAGKLELCCLPTPISCHAPMCLVALEAGANVLVEKPLAATLADANAIADAERSSGRFVAVGYQDMYQPENLALKRALLRGAIGRLREIRVCAVRPRPLGYYGRNHWAGRIKARGVPVYDSPVNNAFAHFVNLALFFAGPSPESAARPLRVRADLFRAQPIENFDTAVLHGETDTGVALKIYATHSCETALPLQILLVGDTGTAEWTSGGSIRIKTAGAEEQFSLPSFAEARRRMFDRLAARLADPAVFVCGVPLATEQVRLVNMIQDTATIRDVPPDRCRQRTSESTGDQQIAIPGIEAVFRGAFLEGKIFDEMECPWARP